MQSSSERIATYEKFIEEKLKGDLKELERLLTTKVDQHKNWQELKNFVEHIQDRQSDELVTNFSIGCEVYMMASIKSFETLLVKVGCDYYLEMRYPEASKFADLKMKKVITEIEYLRGQAAYVKANIKLTLLAIHELHNKKP